jgi:hypothetical protein
MPISHWGPQDASLLVQLVTDHNLLLDLCLHFIQIFLVLFIRCPNVKRSLPVIQLKLKLKLQINLSRFLNLLRFLNFLLSGTSSCLQLTMLIRMMIRPVCMAKMCGSFRASSYSKEGKSCSGENCF